MSNANIISGVITNIVSYTDGTSQIGIVPWDEGKAYESLPFFGRVNTEVLGREVDITELKRPGKLVQIIEGSDFSLTAVVSDADREKIREYGREVVEERRLI